MVLPPSHPLMNKSTATPPDPVFGSRHLRSAQDQVGAPLPPSHGGRAKSSEPGAMPRSSRSPGYRLHDVSSDVHETYRVLREFGSRAQRTFAAIRESHDYVVLQRFARSDLTSFDATVVSSEGLRDPRSGRAVGRQALASEHRAGEARGPRGGQSRDRDGAPRGHDPRESARAASVRGDGVPARRPRCASCSMSSQGFTGFTVCATVTERGSAPFTASSVPRTSSSEGTVSRASSTSSSTPVEILEGSEASATPRRSRSTTAPPMHVRTSMRWA